MQHFKTASIPGPSGSTSDALTGNKSAAQAAAKAKAAVEAIVVDTDALLLAERNAIIDYAIDRMEHGWSNGYLGQRHHRGDMDVDTLLDGVVGSKITEEFAELLRTPGTNNCAIGAISAGWGPFSREAAVAAMWAVSDHLANTDYGNQGGAYGYPTGDNIYQFNDHQKDAGPVIAAFKEAKSQPLHKSED